jgi:hypothetical protein
MTDEAPTCLCERCCCPVDLSAGGLSFDIPYNIKVPDRNGVERTVAQVGKCYLCHACMVAHGKELPRA